MIIYFIVLVIVLFLTFLDVSFGIKKNTKLKKELVVLFGFFFILFAGLRWETGTDWENYNYFFNTIKQFPIGKTGFEFLFEILARIVQGIFVNYHFMLLFTAFIIITLTYNTVYKFSPYPILSIFLLYTYSLNSSGFGYRQDIAIAICFFSVLFIYQRRLIPFLVSITIAFFFHQSALIFLPAYWIFKIKWNIKFVILLVGASILMYLIFSKIEPLVNLFFGSSAYKLERYATEFEGSTRGIIISILNRVIIILIPLLIISTNKNKNTHFIKSIFNIILLGTIMYLILSPLGTVFTRLTRYYDIFQIVLLPCSLLLANKNEKLVYFSFILLYYIFKFVVVILTDPHLFVPYQSDLF
mgnify:CR=1 FL=1